MAAAKKSPSKGRKTKKKVSAWTRFRNGQTISLDYLKKNGWVLIIFLVLVISLIGMRYKTKTKMVEIVKLERELSIAESERLVEKAEYMSLIRENEMQHLVEKKGLGLTFQEQPPYEIHVEDKNP